MCIRFSNVKINQIEYKLYTCETPENIIKLDLIEDLNLELIIIN